MNLGKVNGAVLVKETISPLILFSKGLFDDKLMWLIKMYEKEENKVPKDEIVELIQHTARGIWKVVRLWRSDNPRQIFGAAKDSAATIKLATPGYGQLEEYAKLEFPELSDAKAKYFTRESIVLWVKRSEQVQELLFIITDTQTYERAKKSFDLIVSVCTLP